MSDEITNATLVLAPNGNYDLNFDCEVGSGKNLDGGTRSFEKIAFQVIDDAAQTEDIIHKSMQITQQAGESDLVVESKKGDKVRSSVTVSFG